MNIVDRTRLSTQVGQVAGRLLEAILTAPETMHPAAIAAMEADHVVLLSGINALDHVRTDDESAALRELTKLFERYPSASSLAQIVDQVVADLKKLPDVDINPNARCLGCGAFLTVDAETMRAVRIGLVTHAAGNRPGATQLCGGNVAPLSLIGEATVQA